MFNPFLKLDHEIEEIHLSLNRAIDLMEKCQKLQNLEEIEQFGEQLEVLKLTLKIPPSLEKIIMEEYDKLESEL